MVKFLLMQADLVTACSRSLLDKLGTISQELMEKGICVPNANPIKEERDAARIHGLVPDKCILSVGSLIHRKGHDVLIRAIGKAKEKGFFINLIIVGGGSEAANLSNLARSVGVSEQIHFAGEVDHDKVHGYYTNCRYFVLATRAEGMPLTLLEAMTFGKAVVATTVDGIPEIIHDGATGLLVPPENAEALANALVRLESDSALRAQLARQGQAFVLREHTWDHLTERYIEIYERLLGAKSAISYERRPIGS
jgi:glycosyltransferase involved in cell wall biosynthesis